jgi:hypothetical protein
MGSVKLDAPSLQILRSPDDKHSDQDTIDWVPAVGLEAVTRAYAKIIDQVNKVDRRQLPRRPRRPAPVGRGALIAWHTAAGDPEATTCQPQTRHGDDRRAADGDWPPRWRAAAAALATVARAGAHAPDHPDLTYHKDVEPIIQRACQECHRPGSIAPLSLVAFKDVRPWARAIKNRVARREMPPWHIEKGVGVQHFKHDRGLSDREIETIVAWVDGGAIEGNAGDAPPARVFTDDDQWTIGSPISSSRCPKP